MQYEDVCWRSPRAIRVGAYASVHETQAGRGAQAAEYQPGRLRLTSDVNRVLEARQLTKSPHSHKVQLPRFPPSDLPVESLRSMHCSVLLQTVRFVLHSKLYSVSCTTALTATKSLLSHRSPVSDCAPARERSRLSYISCIFKPRYYIDIYHVKKLLLRLIRERQWSLRSIMTPRTWNECPFTYWTFSCLVRWTASGVPWEVWASVPIKRKRDFMWFRRCWNLNFRTVDLLDRNSAYTCFLHALSPSIRGVLRFDATYSW